ncbi:hypothetical protein [Spirillospora sp. NPDC047279]|uniref:hypothetical protein n=1 Tax=Spirillospora sp. NPDC047279 TaxID=3155478 RepID=UPI0033E3FCC1
MSIRRVALGAGLALTTAAVVLNASPASAAYKYHTITIKGAEAELGVERQSDGRVRTRMCVRDTAKDGHAAMGELAVRFIGDSNFYIGVDFKNHKGGMTTACRPSHVDYWNVDKLYGRAVVTEKGSTVRSSKWKVIWSRSSGGKP